MRYRTAFHNTKEFIDLLETAQDYGISITHHEFNIFDLGFCIYDDSGKLGTLFFVGLESNYREATRDSLICTTISIDELIKLIEENES